MEDLSVNIESKRRLAEIVSFEEIERARERLAVFVEKYNFPAHILQVLQPENILYFKTGLPANDRRLINKYVKDLSLATELFDEDFQVINRGELEPIDQNDDDLRGKLRRNINTDQREWSWEYTLYASAELGLFQSGMLGYMASAMRAGVFHIYGSTSGIVEHRPFFQGGDFELLTGEPGQGTIHEGDISRRLQELGLTDLSQERLDTCFEMFHAVAQIELTRLALHDILDLKRVSQIKNALNFNPKEFFDSVVRAITQDDLASKIALLEGVESFCEGMLEARPVSMNTGNIVMLVRRIDGLVHQFKDQVTMYNIVYEHQGLPIPDLLRAITPEDIIQERAGRERRKEAKRLEHIKKTQFEKETGERKATVKLQHASLLEQVAAARKSWILSSKERKTRGLAEVNKGLLQGFKLASGETINISIPADEAPVMTDLLARLQELISSSKQASALGALQAAISLQDVLEAQRDEIYRDVKQLGLTGLEYPPVLKLREYTARIHAQWSVFEKLLHEKWPKDGRVVASDIKILLDALYT